MSDLAPCPACHRHVRVDEPACPFCGGETPAATPRPASRTRLSRAAVFAGAALAAGGAATSAGCGGKAKPADDNTITIGNSAPDAGVAEPPDAEPTRVDPDYDHQIPMPYGAPPVRQRLV
ncbi:MAG: hypothetical protein H6709_00165 [Kofleriaceae bacterium]|nr:hypothetical protein [Kofleriaceae bacterium]